MNTYALAFRHKKQLHLLFEQSCMRTRCIVPNLMKKKKEKQPVFLRLEFFKQGSGLRNVAEGGARGKARRQEKGKKEEGNCREGRERKGRERRGREREGKGKRWQSETGKVREKSGQNEA